MIVWGLFLLGILIFLALDLGVFNKNPHIISVKEASMWTSIWVCLSFLFSGVIYWLYSSGNIDNVDGLTPTDATIKYVTGYLIELSLSIDNIFVIAVIFSSLHIPQKYQHRVLFWGILGAIVFRALMILFGVALINKFSFSTYIFGAFLLFTAFKMLFSKEEKFNPKNSFIYRNLRKVMPITTHMEGQKFFIKLRHITAATPLFVALIIIEFTDILFALDSVPAILAITSDPFLVFSSNIFAILGLRSMYFFLANMLNRFSYLKYSLVAILCFVGIKLILVHHYKFPEWLSLGFIALSLAAGIIISLNRKVSKED
ncbi:Inner membrane protein alx [Mariniflexile rhizosphaerae]|uniref:TerC family protein n=1 Tax=unclassified Mariniflexile TaxID=2643887 RepID=UPI000CCAD110|nr:TerC family protein [Mariniflexile sp. TRM1-10]AXP82679.1 Inner membrane protein alx [Mariniflexile sp. TRM1-10]PLB18917.1 MAG: Integral membrane protein TerC [Flavobacteriaceae bacterium FS1-H7996/R]